MDIKHNNSEKGQAIVFLVLGFVVFLGFVALAIDGGMVLSDRRHEQNAADASSLAGGAVAALHISDNRSNSCNQQWTCDNNSIIQAAEAQAIQEAKNRADANSYTIDNNIGDHNGVDFSCGGDSWNFATITVTVEISATTPSNFLQLVFPTAMHNTVDASTRIDPGGPLQFGNAIVALNPANCTGQLGVSFHGTGDINIIGGGIFSNGCVRADGTAHVNGDPNWPISGSDVDYDPGKDDISPPPTEVTYQYPAYTYDIDPPDCPSDPGAWYTDKTLPNNLSAGLYCINGDLTFKKGPFIGDGVTFFLQDGGVTINGNEEVRLYAPPHDPDPSPAIPGILFFLPPTNHSTVKLNGTSQVTITGVIFAPGSKIVVTGTDNVTSFESTQFIGWDVEVGGTSDTNIVYDGCDGYIFPPYIELYK
ncbi:MAG: hypothetical protein A2136_08095 [Chloroflexi bacterium RBG_16_54_11]|nr:MAG: hypothetical protein A2136_08095 [Chloroflexi bacterium RBG_16_54_11]